MTCRRAIERRADALLASSSRRDPAAFIEGRGSGFSTDNVGDPRPRRAGYKLLFRGLTRRRSTGFGGPPLTWRVEGEQ